MFSRLKKKKISVVRVYERPSVAVRSWYQKQDYSAIEGSGSSAPRGWAPSCGITVREVGKVSTPWVLSRELESTTPARDLPSLLCTAVPVPVHLVIAVHSLDPTPLDTSKSHYHVSKLVCCSPPFQYYRALDAHPSKSYRVIRSTLYDLCSTLYAALRITLDRECFLSWCGPTCDSAEHSRPASTPVPPLASHPLFSVTIIFFHYYPAESV